MKLLKDNDSKSESVLLFLSTNQVFPDQFQDQQHNLFQQQNTLASNVAKMSGSASVINCLFIVGMSGFGLFFT